MTPIILQGITMNLNQTEKKTFIILMISTFLAGLVTCLSSIQDIIAKKALHSLDWQLTLLTMIWPVSNFFSIWWGKILENAKNKAKYFVIVAFLGRLILVFGLWVNNMTEFLLLLTLVYFFSSLLIPATNSIYQNNIEKQNRGKLFGYSVSTGTFLSMIITFIAGKLLDTNEDMFRWILFFTGISGCLSSLILSFVKINSSDRHTDTKISLKELFISPVSRTFQLLKSNKDFAQFERNFSLYGLGFLMVIPIIPIYLVEHLNMNYTSTFIAKGILAQVGVLLLSPFFGKLHDRKNIFHFGSIVFAILSLYPLGFILSILFHSPLISVILVFASYLIYGIAMAGVNITWTMGSITFAGKEDSAMYQSVHISITGIRGLIAPLFGFLVYKSMGIISVFIISFLCELIASFTSYRYYKIKEYEESGLIIEGKRFWGFWN